ncbi:hypothetical protein PIB30_098076, partial [Stylosanthes scabra]|nr:hypothetical protein [Stylosanthes scabra]
KTSKDAHASLPCRIQRALWTGLHTQLDAANLYDSQQSDKCIRSSSATKEWVIVPTRKGALSNNCSSSIRSNRVTKN